MKIITIAVALCLLFALQSAFAAEGAAKNDEGMQIAEQLLLREDLSEPLPAKEEKIEKAKKIEDKKDLSEAPLLAEDVTSEDATDVVDSAAKLALAINGTEDKKAAELPGTPAYDSQTVDMIADSPMAPAFEEGPGETSVAKR